MIVDKAIEDKLKIDRGLQTWPTSNPNRPNKNYASTAQITQKSKE